MKYRMSKAEYEDIKTRSRVASTFLKGKDNEFIRNMLIDAFNYARDSILHNSVHDVTEEVTISEKLKRLFFTPKKQQVDELRGQYKLIEKFFRDVEYVAGLKETLDKDIEKGAVFLQEEKKAEEAKDENYARG